MAERIWREFDPICGGKHRICSRLSYAGDLEPDTLLSMDAGFLNFRRLLIETLRPIFPGNQDVIHGQYLHRPEGSDIDFYKFDIDFGPNGENRTGVFVAETFAERSDRGSLLDTRIAFTNRCRRPPYLAWVQDKIFRFCLLL